MKIITDEVSSALSGPKNSEGITKVMILVMLIITLPITIKYMHHSFGVFDKYLGLDVNAKYSVQFAVGQICQNIRYHEGRLFKESLFHSQVGASPVR